MVRNRIIRKTYKYYLRQVVLALSPAYSKQRKIQNLEYDYMSINLLAYK